MNHLKRLINTGLELEAKAPGAWFHGMWTGKCKDNHAHHREVCNYIYSREKMRGMVSSLDHTNMMIFDGVQPDTAELVVFQKNHFRNILTALSIATEALQKCGHSRLVGKNGVAPDNAEIFDDRARRVMTAQDAIAEISALFPEEKREDETPTKGVRE